MEDLKCLSIVCVTIMVVVATIAFAAAHTTATKTTALNEMVQKGADPLHAKCAVYGC